MWTELSETFRLSLILMTLVNDGSERCELCHEGTQPVTSNATTSRDMWLWHLTLSSRGHFR